MKSLMEEDGQRYLKALEKTGVHLGTAEPVVTMTLRYEADVDLPTAAAEAGVKPDEFLKALNKSEALAGNLGALKVSGGTLQRQVYVQAFADVVRALRLGTPLQPGAVGQSLPDNTGEIDPLEGPTSTTNAVAFSSDGKKALSGGYDHQVFLWDLEKGKELLLYPSTYKYVNAVAIAPDGKHAAIATQKTIVLCDVDTGKEVGRIERHTDSVTSLAFSPDGKRLISTSDDRT